MPSSKAGCGARQQFSLAAMTGAVGDQVTPLNIEKWTDGTQFRYGSRVPCLVLSPYTGAGYISKTLHSFVSIVKFCEENFAVLSINQRDASADNMSDCFDFRQTLLGPTNRRRDSSVQ